MDGNTFDRPGARLVVSIREARSLGIAIALRKPAMSVDASPHDPHRNHFLNRNV